MPMKPGKSRATVSENIREFHTGPRYQKAAAKFGKKKADKIAVAAALSSARRSGAGRKKPAGNHDPHNAVGSH
jgi:hypothetical protein